MLTLPSPRRSDPVLDPASCHGVDRNLGAAAERAFWREVDASFPRSAAVGVALVPGVLRIAAGKAAAARDAELAFVADVAFGGRLDEARLARQVHAASYAGVRAAVCTLVREAVHGRIWERWEAAWMYAACARIVGQLRRAQPAEPPDTEADEETDLACWLLAGSEPLRPPDRAASPGCVATPARWGRPFAPLSRRVPGGTGPRSRPAAVS